jgi:hypothetical protein
MVLSLPPGLAAYSVLTHEAIIDSVWKIRIEPLLRERFPQATKEELHVAHAYTYGGAIIQDMGYYPHGSKFFSDLLHYVRSGDFIQALLRDAKNLNDYAFAVGSLAHYAADDNGHRLAVNQVVPVLYPKLQRKYGNVVTYANDPLSHLKTEFAFDVVEVAKGRYAPDDYHEFIGFEVSKPLIEQAFADTYSLDLNSLFTDLDLAIGSYRHNVSSVIPKATKLAWQIKKDDIQKDIPGITRKQFLYNLSRASYRKKWGNKYQAPGFGTKLLAFILRLIPKFGPLRALQFRPLTPPTELVFMDSFNKALENYQELLGELQKGHLVLANKNFDTGDVTPAGAYSLCDKAYAELLHRLAAKQFAQISPELRTNILDYYSNLNAPIATKKNPKEWSQVLTELDELKSNVPASKPPTTPGAAPQ